MKRNPYLVSLIGLSKCEEDYYLLTEFCNSVNLLKFRVVYSIYCTREQTLLLYHGNKDNKYRSKSQKECLHSMK